MRRNITSIEARAHIDEVFDSVFEDGDEVIVERDGTPIAVVIPPERYASLERARERFFAMIDEVHERNKDVPVEVIEAEVNEAVAEVRGQMARSRSA